MIQLHGAEASDAEAREQSAMLASVLDLGEVTVDEVMTHRGSVEMIDVESAPEDALRQVMESPLYPSSRFSGKPENIIGVLHVKALLRGLIRPLSQPCRNHHQPSKLPRLHQSHILCQRQHF